MDWKKLIQDLRDWGLTQKEIGDEMPGDKGRGRGQSWVADVEAGKYDDLKYGDGVALIALHKRVARRQKKAA